MAWLDISHQLYNLSVSTWAAPRSLRLPWIMVLGDLGALLPTLLPRFSFLLSNIYSKFQEKLDFYLATRQMIPRFQHFEAGSKFLRSKSVRLQDFRIRFLIPEALWSVIVGALAAQWHSQYGSGMWAHLCWCRCGGWVAVEKPMTVMNELKFLWRGVFSVAATWVS